MHIRNVRSDLVAAARGPNALAAGRSSEIKSLVKRRRAQILHDTAEQLLQGDDPYEQVMPTLYKALAAERLVDASLGFIVSKDGAALTLAFAKGLPSDFVDRCLRLDFGQAICGTAAARRKPMHVTDIQRTLDPMADLVRSAGIAAYASEPLLVGDRLLGTLSFASRTRRSFQGDDLLFFRAIAELIARALNREKPAVRGAGPQEHGANLPS